LKTIGVYDDVGLGLHQNEADAGVPDDFIDALNDCSQDGDCWALRTAPVRIAPVCLFPLKVLVLCLVLCVLRASCVLSCVSCGRLVFGLVCRAGVSACCSAVDLFCALLCCASCVLRYRGRVCCPWSLLSNLI
jgi:hypothetical protein